MVRSTKGRELGGIRSGPPRRQFRSPSWSLSTGARAGGSLGPVEPHRVSVRPLIVAHLRSWADPIAPQLLVTGSETSLDQSNQPATDETTQNHRRDGDPNPDGTGRVSMSRGSNPPGDHPETEEEAGFEDLIDDLSDIAHDIERPDIRQEIQETKELLSAAGERGLIESDTRHLDPSDAGEAFVGSVIFAAPLLVEDGVFAIADHLFMTLVYGLPVFLIANTLFVVVMTYALLEWTGRKRTESAVLFGVIPYRLFMILAVSFAVSAVLMTVWGRVGDWQPLTEALSRINVLWTVGSLGAALGDILSERPTGTPRKAGRIAAEGDLSDSELLSSLHTQFETLESTVSDTDVRREVQRIRATAQEAIVGGTFGQQIQKYTTRDMAEAYVGSIFFSIPFLVEDGVFDVADFFLSFRIGQFPVYFLVNAGFVVLIVAALVYWAGPQDVQVTRPILGVVPRRLVGITVISFLTAAALMTLWGRVGNWQDPVVAIARISAVWTVASFGAALGDVLPGESSGDDIYEEFQ